MKKALVYCSHGLGDGLIFLVISKNLSQQGYIVDTFHPSLFQLQNWIDYTNLKPYPGVSLNSNLTNLDLTNQDLLNLNFLKNYDLIIINSDYQILNKQIIKYLKTNHVNNFYEIHPSTCKGKNPPIGDLKFDFTKPVVENLCFFCKNTLNLNEVVASNSLKPLDNLIYRKNPNRISIHPTSKDIKKNWPKKKFKKLCNKLINLGYEPFLILRDFEKKDFEGIDIEKPNFINLEEIASFIYQSGYFIGNDSGLAHLASSLKIPTLTIFSTKRKERFWKPSFFIGKTVVSFPLINISRLRLREKFWKKTITVRKVLKKFINMVKEYESCHF